MVRGFGLLELRVASDDDQVAAVDVAGGRPVQADFTFATIDDIGGKAGAVVAVVDFDFLKLMKASHFAKLGVDGN